jgi:GNAT superfamily N-acetyltransferase
MEMRAWLEVVGRQYRTESGDPTPNGFNLERVRNAWIHGDASMMLWLLSENGKVCGYGVTSIGFNGTEKTCFVDEAWIAEDMRRKGVPQKFLEAVEKWAKKFKVESVTFGTFRNPFAYERFLNKQGYQMAEVYFVKKVRR